VWESWLIPLGDRVAIVAGRSQGIALSFLYWSLRRLLELVVLRFRSEREKEIEILLLRHQLLVLERQLARCGVSKFGPVPGNVDICRRNRIFAPHTHSSGLSA